MRKIYQVHVFNEGDQVWYYEDKIHRENGAAQECADGSKFWFLNGVYHRLDGPAIMYADGTRYYYINGAEYTKDVYNTIVGNVVDYFTSVHATEFPDEYSALDIISKMNEIVINDMDKVRNYCDKKITVSSIIKYKFTQNDLLKEWKDTMTLAKETVAKSKKLREFSQTY